MHAALRSAPPVPPSPSPRPEIDVWFQTAGGGHPHVLKHDILTTSSIYAAPSAAPRSRRAVSRQAGEREGEPLEPSAPETRTPKKI